MTLMTVEREGEFWPTRIAMLAELAHTDALAVVLRPHGDAFITYAAHNVSGGQAWNDPAATALLGGALDGAAADGAVAVQLSDGRVALAMRALPIAWKDHRIGALAALRTSGPFSDAESANLARLAALIALELVEENTFWRIQRAASELEARTKASSELQEIVRAERDPKTLLESATTGLARVFAADGVSIMLIEDGILSVHTAVGLNDEGRRDRKRVGEGISVFVAQSGQPLLLHGPVNGNRPFHGNDPSITDAMIAPLRNGDHTIGVVNVKHRGVADPFDATDLDALTAIGGDIAATLSFVGAVSRAEEDRKQAIALYELSRLGTLGTEPQEELETAVAMLADVMHHDVVCLWILDDQGVAHRRAARGYAVDSGTSILTDAIDEALARALAGERAVRAHAPEAGPAPPALATGPAPQYGLAP